MTVIRSGKYVRLPRPVGSNIDSQGPYIDNELQRVQNSFGNYTEIAPASHPATVSDPRIYGWNDMVTDLGTISGRGPNTPTWAATGYGGHQGWTMSPTVMEELFLSYHVTHDYMPHTGLWFHVHWEPIDANAGTVRWGIEINWAKGHQQEAYTANAVTLYVEQDSTGVAFDHMIAEISDTDAANFEGGLVEPDTVLKVRLFRDAAHVNDTYASAVNVSFCDVHYKTDRHSTLFKSPNFYDG